MSGQIQVDALDFAEIKNNIRVFLQGQTTLKDYNYEGSALSILIDVLAYNTHYNSLYTNFVANEMFLDSASKYSSAVSLAKTIGYTPTSYRSAVAKITLTVTLPDNETPVTHTIPKGTTFVAPYGEYVDYLFSTITDYTATRVSGVYVFPDIEIYEGKKQTRSYTHVDGIQFVIPHKNVDTTTLAVDVRDNGSSSNSTIFNYATDLLRVKPTDFVYFTKQREDLYYEIYFGNGIIGKAIQPGNIVKMTYMESSGSGPNGAAKFTYFGGHRADLSYNVSVTSSAIGGTEAETLESIKFNAPKAYTAQNRAVTVSDYETLVYNSFPNIQTVKVWGGQDNIPKVYGKVFVCAKPYGKEFLNGSEEAEIMDVLNSRKVMTMLPTLVSPDFMRIEMDAAIYYNKSTSRKTAGEMESIVRGAIQTYNDTLNKFNASFRYSTISGILDKLDPAIISNIVNIRVRSPISPAYNTISNYVANFGNPIYSQTNGGTFFSTKFYESAATTPCYLIDDGLGKIILMTETLAGAYVKVRDVGTISYSTGAINISDINVASLYDPEFEFIFYPSSNDIIPVRQYILTLPAEYVTVRVIADNISAGDNQANTNHIFTPSR